jgi:hypothetical protein
MNGTQDITVTRGETVKVGNSQYYTRGGFPTATLVTVGGETFLEIDGTLYAQCGYCEYGTKSWHGNVFGGVCFQCDGRGYDRKIGTVEAAAKRVHNRNLRQARAARKAAAEAAAKAQAGLAWRADNPTLADMLDAIYIELCEACDANDYTVRDAFEARWGDFVSDMANQVGMGRPLTANQTTAVAVAIQKALTEQAAAEAKQAAQRYYGTKGDKVVATGTVAVAMNIETENYATGMPESKRLVVVEGTGEFTGVTFKVVGVGATLWEAERGQTVELRGAVKDHRDYNGVQQTIITRGKITQQ